MVAKKLSGLRSLWFGISLSIMLSSGSYSTECGIRLENLSELVDGGRYNWTVYVVAEEPVLNEIDHVVYFLDPSFREPKRIIDTRENRFSLSASGRGEFLITAKVVLKNGEAVLVEHWLRLEANRIPDEEPEPPPPPRDEERGLTVRNTADFLKGDRWEWTIYIAAPDEVLEQIECVHYILDPSYREPRREVCEKGPIAGAGFMLMEMARKPFDIGAEIRFVDGQTKSLVHRLRTPHLPEEYELVALQSTQNDAYIRAGVGGESYLAAVSDHIRGWETFRLIMLDENMVALQSIQNERNVRAGVGNESFLAATSGHIMEWETFRLFQLEDDMVALQSIENNGFVRAGVGDNAYLAAVSPDIGGWELFRLIYIEKAKH
jgi:transcription initiation factor IIF auxiliary subunit